MSEELKSLIKSRGTIKRRQTVFKKFVDNFLESNAGLSIKDIDKQQIIELESRLERGSLLLEEFDIVQNKIELLTEDDDVENEILERDEFETTFFDITSKCKMVISVYYQEGDTNTNAEIEVDRESRASSSNSFNIQGVKLPDIDLPKFAGDYKNFLEFRDLFESLIHSNRQISNIQKFHYLRASLQGGAAQVIRSIKVTADNYEIAWDTLCSRYHNKTVLINNHVRALFNIPALTSESSSELRKMLDNMNKNLRSLQMLNLPTEHWDVLLIHVFASKLDKNTAREWEERKANVQDRNNREGDAQLPTLKDFNAFLRQRADLLENLELSKERVVTDAKCKPKGVSRSQSFAVVGVACIMCKGSHTIQGCPEFSKLSVNERVEKVKALRLCFNCLQGNHPVKSCRSSMCRKSGSKHHTLIHYNRSETDTGKGNSGFEPSSNRVEGDNLVRPREESSSSGNLSVSLSSGVYNGGQVLLQTAMVQVYDSSGVPRMCRALLDGASQSDLITSKCAERLGLRKQNLCLTIVGVGENVSHLKYRCDVRVQSSVSCFEVNLSCLVIPRISSTYPASDIDISSWNIPNNLKLADPEFNRAGEIDLLIGSSIYLNLLCIGQICLGPNLPTLQKTRFGWVLGGKFQTRTASTISRCHLTTNLDIQSQLTKFWEIEEPMHSKPAFSNDELQCEEIFSKTTKRTVEGRFVVQIPLKQSVSVLGDSRANALRRFKSLEIKLSKNLTLKRMYTDFLEEYRSLGHMSRVRVTDESSVSHYFPHHGVLNERSQTTKLRVVFDGSAATDTGISFNDIQFVGPTIQDDLLSILLRFRQYNVVVCADIIKMYRQVLICPQQRCLQRILWRSNSSDEIEVYELNRVSYGTASAPFLAVRCLKELAIINSKVFPDACRVIEKDFYVDDMLSGADTVEEAVQLCDDVSAILKSACFELQKWASNSKAVLQHVQSYDSAPSFLKLGEGNKTKTLGLHWACASDTLMYSISESSFKHITKRSVLSDISQIFDPLGLLSPCTIVAKIILQRLWLDRVSWDEALSIELDSRWRHFRSLLTCLNTLKIERQVVCVNPCKIEIHGFADASLEAYGACVYVRSINNLGDIRVNLLMSKSKVAPLRSITIPRLELCAALVLSQLIHKIKSAMSLRIEEYFLWSDSTVCLSWIHTPPNILQTFVSNRVSQIQSFTDPKDWRHIRTVENPADLLSRGMDPSQLPGTMLWWHGPTWLSQPQERWPRSGFQPQSEVPELKKQARNFKIEVIELFPFTRFAKLIRLRRVFGYCLRFLTNIRSEDRITGPLSASELEHSLHLLVKMAQREVFSEEIESLKGGKPLRKGSLLSLNPFVDPAGVLRVGGRLGLSNFEYEKRHPALLAGKHHLTKLIFTHEHLRLLHAGPQLLLFTIREKFWPIGGRNLARQTVHNCIRCFRSTPTQKNPIMGMLPELRVTPALPFHAVGIDYAGPFYIKDRKGRGGKISKCYLSLFVCFSTKACHLELVSDLTSEAFLASFRRFTSRRGKPLHVYSDNGTNFVGAKSELDELGRFLRQNEHVIPELTANQGVTWHFIPALSPHMGGLWEAGVKSCKSHLKRILSNSPLTFEEFCTVLTEVEAVLNSRPLTPLSTDPNDMSALTPAHFLIGKPLTSLPQADLKEVKEGRLSYFQRLQQMQQHFWSRWSKEYISELQERSKWRFNTDGLKVGTLVVLKDDSAPPLQWRLGRILEVYPGKDGIARVALVKTSKGEIKRSFVKICPLPVETVNPDSDVKKGSNSDCAM